jgi:urea transport system ATP-binding protein
MGLLPIKSGQMVYDGQPINRVAAERRASIGIGYVPQGRQIFPLLTVEENLQIGLPARRDRARKVPEFIYELFPVLREMLSRRGGDLSGGQQQQLAIGRALVTDPKLLILDEPTEGIQPNIVHEIGDIIRKLNREIGLTVLLVEQKLPFARRVADRFCILDRGRAMATGQMPDLNDELIKQYLTV